MNYSSIYLKEFKTHPMKKIILITLCLILTNYMFAQIYTCNNFEYVNISTYSSIANGGYENYSYEYNDNTYLCPGNIDVRFEFSLREDKTLDYDDVDYFELSFSVPGSGIFKKTVQKSSLSISNQKAVFYGTYPTSMLDNLTTNGYAYQILNFNIIAILKYNITTQYKYSTNGFVRGWYAPDPYRFLQIDLCKKQFDGDGDGVAITVRPCHRLWSNSATLKDMQLYEKILLDLV